MYTGQKDNNVGTLENARSFCEGLQYRTMDTAANVPVTDNPHIADSEAGEAWIRGWTVADNAAGGTIDKTLAPNCAVPGTVVAA